MHLRTAAFRLTFCGLVDVSDAERPAFEPHVGCVPAGDEVKYLRQVPRLAMVDVCDACLEGCARKTTGDLEVLRAMRAARADVSGTDVDGYRGRGRKK